MGGFFEFIGKTANFIGIADPIMSRLKSERADYSDFIALIKRIVRKGCTEYCTGFLEKSSEYRDITFLEDYKSMLCQAVISAIESNVEFTVDMVLPNEEGFPEQEKSRLHRIIMKRLELHSLEFLIRNRFLKDDAINTELLNQIKEIQRTIVKREKAIAEVESKSIVNGDAFAGLIFRVRPTEAQYWEQDIVFNKQGNKLPARIDEATNCEETKNSWLTTISDETMKNPILLTAPGGMGKTAFLTHLYQTVEQNINNGLFSKVILVSLESLVASAQSESSHNDPFDDPSQSLMLNHISEMAGDKSASSAWYNAMSEGLYLHNKKPILLLLDGFNEMRVYTQLKVNAYTKVLSEIAGLSNQKRFPYVRMIVSSRVESDEELKNQLRDLMNAKADFALANLGGIHVPEYISSSNVITPEMRELLMRPMYYQHFKDSAKMPKNRYEALRIMYEALCSQSEDNAITYESKKIRDCLFEFFVPIVARHMLRNANFSGADFDHCYSEMRNQCTLLLIDDKFRCGGTEMAGRMAEKVINAAYDLLSKQEQIIIIKGDKKDNTYVFTHQDYRDFLAGEYFLQRLHYMMTKQDSRFWDDKTIDLDLFTYNKEALRLIYQSLEFESRYKDYFLVHKTKINSSQITSGYLRYIYAAFQLSDLSRLAEIPYEIEKLRGDTLQVLNPLTTYARNEASGRTKRMVLKDQGDDQKKWLTEILMKSCELHRRKEQFDIASDIAKAAKYLYSPVTEESLIINQMQSVINHNIAKVNLYDFMVNGNRQHLGESLDMLFECAVGKEDVLPNLFSCTILSMLLVSPQPYLECLDEYKAFLHRKLQGESRYIFAFWTYYRAMFWGGEPREDWLLLLYPMRQFLFLLADNRVQIADCDLEQLDVFSLEDEKLQRSLSVVVAPTLSPFPSKANIIVIDRFLDRMDGINTPWKTYLEGLVFLVKDNDGKAAHERFSKADDESGGKDIRAKLWVAALNSDNNQLREIWQNGLGNSTKNPNISIDSYNGQRWYERDITGLYRGLRLEVLGVPESETIDAITQFLFIGKPIHELGKYDLVLVLGNDDIKGTVYELYKLYEGGSFTQNCHIILTGNVGTLNSGKPPEAERLLNEAQNVGMPEELFWLEKRATNTFENFSLSKGIIEAQGGGFDKFSSILCIGKAFMMRRAKMCAAACAYPLEKLDFYGTVDRTGRNIGSDTWWVSETARTRVMEEIGRISEYTLKGDLSIV